MTKRILCTGDAGFIGSHVRAALNAAGYDTQGADIKRGERENICKITAEQIEGVDTIVHHAAQSSQAQSIADPLGDIYHNVIGTMHLLRIGAEVGVRHFVFASTSCVYEDEGTLTERTPYNPRNPYGITKLAAEGFIRSSGIPYTIFRYANVYGAGQVQVGENQVIAHCLDHLLNGKPFAIHGTGEKKRDFIHVSDVADANLRVIERALTGVYNLGTEMPHAINEVCRVCASLCGFDNYEFTHDADRPGEAQMTKLVSIRFRDAARWQPQIILADGLARTVAWWKANKVGK